MVTAIVMTGITAKLQPLSVSPMRCARLDVAYDASEDPMANDLLCAKCGFCPCQSHHVICLVYRSTLCSGRDVPIQNIFDRTRVPATTLFCGYGICVEGIRYHSKAPPIGAPIL